MTDKLINEFNLNHSNISILVKDLRENKIIIKKNIEHKVISASIIKVMILMCLYKKVSEGKISLHDKVKFAAEDILEDSKIGEIFDLDLTINDISTWMIIESDNMATNVLIDILGFEEINILCNNLSLENTSLTRKMLDFKAITNGFNNYTSLKDSLIVMELLYKGDFISKDISNKIISILKQQRDYRLLRRYLYDITIAHKTGELPGILHDMGIIYGEKTDYFIGVFITDVVDMLEAEKFIGRISKYIYQSLN